MSYEEFNDAIQSKQPVLIEFYAPGCSSCKKMEGPLAQLMKDYASQVDVFKAERDNLYDLIIKYDINLIPAFLLFKGGKEIDRIEGATTRANLKKLFSRAH